MKTILVIEDEAEILDNISDLLEGEGYRVVCATTGREGLEEARRREPDLVVCDVMMPEMDGHDVLQEMRSNPTLATIPFIFLTARTTPQDVRTGMNLGADDYLTKPFRATELLDAVASRLSRHQAQQQQMEEEVDALRTDLSQVIPHELRTPLSAVVGFSHFLMEDWDTLDPDAAREMIAHIYEAGQRLERLVENYGLFARLAVLAPGNTRGELDGFTPDTAETIAATTQQCAARMEREQDVQLDAASAALPVQEAFLAKLVEELVENACKFSEAGTPVTVRGGTQDDAYVLTVEDEGRGMTAAQMERVGAFRQFERDRQEQQGLGLGLAVAQRLAHLHDGSLDIDSVPGEGTTVTVRLPCPATMPAMA